MQPKRVLVQWLPSAMLQDERGMLIGPTQAAEVQQVGIELLDPEFALMMALSTPPSNGTGYPGVQVGFAHGTRYSGQWLFSSKPTLVQVATFHYWDTEPTKAQLATHALEAAGGMTPELQARQNRFEVLAATLLQRHTDDTEVERKRIIERSQKDQANIDHAMTVHLNEFTPSPGPSMRPGAATDTGDALPPKNVQNGD